MAELQGEVRGALEQLNGVLRNSGITKYRIELFDPNELTLLKKNARFMAPPTFKQLVANVQKDGQLESLPLIYLERDGTKLVLSGNHRVQAARKAGTQLILCLAIDWELSEGEKVAKQLAHNAIEGQDDLAILKELWSGIQNLDAKVYSGLDERTVKTLETIKFPELKEEPLKFKAINLVFLPEEAQDMREAFAKIEALPGDEKWLASLKHYRGLFDSLVAGKSAFDVVNTAAAMLKLVEVCKFHLGFDGAEDPMGGVRKTEVRFGELAGQVPVALYQRWKKVWDYFLPSAAMPSKRFEAGLGAIVDVLERYIDSDQRPAKGEMSNNE